MDLGINGRAAIVTGGSRGIGFETARRLLEEGAKVCICARGEEGLKAAQDQLISETGGQVAAVRADTSGGGAADEIVRRAAEAFGTVDILVNNAGEMSSGRFEALGDAGLQTQLDTKLFGFLRMIRAAVPHMRRGGWGRIVNIIGGAGKEPDPYMFGSGMTNSALLNLTKSLSTEFGEEGIHVNAVCPGWVDTDLWRRNAGGLAAELDAGSEEEARRRAARKNALGRFGRPGELADAIAFLCSERASYITGVSLNLDGGRLKSLW